MNEYVSMGRGSSTAALPQEIGAAIFVSPHRACRGIPWSGLYLDITLCTTTETSAKKQVNAANCLENDKQSGDT